jgi:tRNA pseudouridine55 synthase
LDDARPLDHLAELADPVTLPLPAAVRRTMPVRSIEADQARALSYGQSLPAAGIEGVYAACTADGTVVALVTEAGAVARPVLVFTPTG